MYQRAGRGSRTLTRLPSAVFETAASTIPPPRPGGQRTGSRREPERQFARTLKCMDDEALLERARHGDRDAFAAIVTRHQDELYTMALRITGPPGQTPRAGLFRVPINCSHDVQRRTVRRPADPLEDDQGNIVELPDPALGPEASALPRERLAAIRR